MITEDWCNKNGWTYKTVDWDAYRTRFKRLLGMTIQPEDHHPYDINIYKETLLRSGIKYCDKTPYSASDEAVKRHFDYYRLDAVPSYGA